MFVVCHVVGLAFQLCEEKFPPLAAADNRVRPRRRYERCRERCREGRLSDFHVTIQKKNETAKSPDPDLERSSQFLFYRRLFDLKRFLNLSRTVSV
jgi:hypothetical protein